MNKRQDRGEREREREQGKTKRESKTLSLSFGPAGRRVRADGPCAAVRPPSAVPALGMHSGAHAPYRAGSGREADALSGHRVEKPFGYCHARASGNKKSRADNREE